MAGPGAPAFTSLPGPQAWLQVHGTTPSFLWSSGRKPSPHEYSASTLQTEPFPQPVNVFFDLQVC